MLNRDLNYPDLFLKYFLDYSDHFQKNPKDMKFFDGFYSNFQKKSSFVLKPRFKKPLSFSLAKN